MDTLMPVAYSGLFRKWKQAERLGRKTTWRSSPYCLHNYCTTGLLRQRSHRTRSSVHMQQQIRTFILSNFLFTDDESKLKNKDSLLAQGIMDSTGVLELVAFLE